MILMDMQMPVMDGAFTATRRLREEVRAADYRADRQAMEKGEEEKCKAAGCSGYLSKPINMDLLLGTLSALTGELPADAAAQVRG